MALLRETDSERRKGAVIPCLLRDRPLSQPKASSSESGRSPSTAGHWTLFKEAEGGSLKASSPGTKIRPETLTPPMQGWEAALGGTAQEGVLWL